MIAESFRVRDAEIRKHVALQGFMNLLGAEIDELTPGSSTISVSRRDDLLQQNGLFHGGVTAFLRAPADGLWRDDEGALEPDEVVILEVMCEELDRPWWASYRERLARELEQKELVVRAIPIETL